jgi:hypothetical protein
MASRKRARGRPGDNGVHVLYVDPEAERLAALLREMPPEVMATLELTMLKAQLQSVVGKMEELVAGGGALADRKLCTVLRAALLARDLAAKDVRHLDQLEHVAAEVERTATEAKEGAQFPPKGFGPVGRGRKPHTVEAERLARALMNSLVRWFDQQPDQIADWLVGDFMRALNFTPALSAMCARRGDQDARNLVRAVFDRFPVQSGDLSVCEKLVVAGLNALGASPAKTRLLFDARRKKEGRKR